MNESFRVYDDSGINVLNRVLEFPVTFVWSEMRFYVRFERQLDKI